MITLGFGNNADDTKNKVVYPSDYPKVLHTKRQPNISGSKDDKHTVYDVNSVPNDSSNDPNDPNDPNVPDEPDHLQQTNDVPKPSNKHE